MYTHVSYSDTQNRLSYTICLIITRKDHNEKFSKRNEIDLGQGKRYKKIIKRDYFQNNTLPNKRCYRELISSA